MKGTLMGVIILVVVVVVGGVAYWQYKAHEAPAAPVVTNTGPTTPVMLAYASSTLGFSINYPEGYTLNDGYQYTAFGPTKPISGVSFTIPASMATGTNLASDSYVSVEWLPHAKNCTADIYLLDNVKATTMTIGSTTYSVASSTGAGAGNRYEETVYALPNSNPCTAVRYFIHYGVIDNYPPGAVQQFNEQALLQSFDSIRDSLTGR